MSDKLVPIKDLETVEKYLKEKGGEGKQAVIDILSKFTAKK